MDDVDSCRNDSTCSTDSILSDEVPLFLITVDSAYSGHPETGLKWLQ